MLPEQPWFILCAPCLDLPPRHEDCAGAQVWCECVVEPLIEAEEAE